MSKLARAATAITVYNNYNNESANVSSSQTEGDTTKTKQPEGN